MSLLIKVPSFSSHPQNSTSVILNLGQIDVRWMQNYGLNFMWDSRICWRVELSSCSLALLCGRYCCKLEVFQGVSYARSCATGAKEWTQMVCARQYIVCVAHIFQTFSTFPCKPRATLLACSCWDRQAVGVFPPPPPTCQDILCWALCQEALGKLCSQSLILFLQVCNGGTFTN